MQIIDSYGYYNSLAVFLLRWFIYMVLYDILCHMDYAKLKSIIIKHNVKGHYHFTDRSKGYKKLCIILIGYKKYLWNDVIGRFKRFVPDDIDVCLLSSGGYLKELEDMAAENSWSYISIKKNNVCLAQNIAINAFPNAELIYKIDEDIFLTEGTFVKMEAALNKAEAELPYRIGMVAPLLNVNAYGYYRILKKLNKLDEYERRFGKCYMEAGQKSPIESNIEIAKFMWGNEGILPQLDVLNDLFSEKQEITVCPIRLSIGCILYKRSFWESFWRFPVVFGNGMGLDETIAIGAASAFCQVLVVAENSVVGHFGYGPQTQAMRQFMESNPKLFAMMESGE